MGEEPEMPIETQWKIARYVFLIGAALIIGIPVIYVIMDKIELNRQHSLYDSSYSNSDVPQTDIQPNATVTSDEKYQEAYWIAQNFVKKQLKSPSSAEFPSYKNEFVENEGGIYTVVSFVDSQNGFGAMLRETFICSMEYRIGTDDWILQDEVYFYDQ